MGKIIEKRAEQYKRDAKILIFLAVLVFVIGGYFGWLRYQTYNTLKEQTKIGEEAAKRDSATKTDWEGIYGKAKADFVTATKIKNQKMAAIFPAKAQITELTRVLDQFFADNNFANNPLLLSSLSFGNVENTENHNKIAFTISAQGSENNFFRFLDFIGNSGNFGKAYRLMAIDSINISFPQQEETEKSEEEKANPLPEEIGFSIQGAAYFQK